MRVVFAAILIVIVISSEAFGKTKLCGEFQNKLVQVTEHEIANGKEIEIAFPSEIEGYRFFDALVIYGNNEFRTTVSTLVDDKEDEIKVHLAHVAVNSKHEKIEFRAAYTRGGCHRFTSLFIDSET